MMFYDVYPEKTDEMYKFLKLKENILDLIGDNLQDDQARYSMIITRGGNAAFILENYLS